MKKVLDEKQYYNSIKSNLPICFQVIDYPIETNKIHLKPKIIYNSYFKYEHEIYTFYKNISRNIDYEI